MTRRFCLRIVKDIRISAWKRTRARIFNKLRYQIRLRVYSRIEDRDSVIDVIHRRAMELINGK